MSKAQARIVETAFSGLGVVGIPGQVWCIEAGVTAPPALLQNSTPFAGPVPHEVITFDAEQAERYRRLNLPRQEPVPEPVLTQAQIEQQRGWTAAQFTEARKTGFPSPTSRRDLFDGDGIPIGHENLWRRDIVAAFFERLTALAGGR